MTRRPTFAFAPDAWDQPPEMDAAPVECTECGKTDCACGEPQSACDGCGDMLPESELHRVRSSSGETDQCERCLGMDADTSRDAAGMKR